MRLLFLSLCFLAVAQACTADLPQGQLEVAIRPLTLENVDRACYDLAVLRKPPNDNEFVWRRTGLCSDQYGGLGGSLTYVGPCDATDNYNTVVLVLQDIYDAHDTPVPFNNPCPHPFGCSLDVECIENQDSQALFDLTVMRPAQQGFFDIAIQVDEIFCSAKFDTCYGGEDPCYLYIEEKEDVAGVDPIKSKEKDPFGGEIIPRKAEIKPGYRYIYYDDEHGWLISDNCWDPFVKGEKGVEELDGVVDEDLSNGLPSGPLTLTNGDGELIPTGDVYYGSEPDWIRLLWGWEDGHKDTFRQGITGVLAMACTAGPGTDTVLTMDHIDITCWDSQREYQSGALTHHELLASAIEGNALPLNEDKLSPDGQALLNQPGQPSLPIDIGNFQDYFSAAVLVPNNDNPPPPSFRANYFPWQWAVYSGVEQLNCDSQQGGMDCGKRYWNTAIGLEGLDGDAIPVLTQDMNAHIKTKFTECHLTAIGTAISSLSDFAQSANQGSRLYPYIEWDIPLLDAEGDLICMQSPLSHGGQVSVRMDECGRDKSNWTNTRNNTRNRCRDFQVIGGRFDSQHDENDALDFCLVDDPCECEPSLCPPPGP